MILRRLIFFGQTVDILLQDSFSDSYLDRNKWESFAIASPYGSGKATERNGRIEFYSPTTYAGSGIKSVNSYDLKNTKLRAKLFSDGYVVAFISIVPYDEEFLASKSKGYSLGIWQLGADKLFVYKNGSTVYRKLTMEGNPEEIEIAVDGGKIRFYEAGNEVYVDDYPYTKNMKIYLWGISWYLNASGTSWADDLQLVKEAPSLTLSVDKTSGYVGDTFTFEGVYKDGQGEPLSGYVVNLMINGINGGSATTGGDGSYSVQWIPTAMGNYSIYAEASSP
jgi:hypothetical protein